MWWYGWACAWMLLLARALAADIPLTPVKAESVGPGAGGALFWPAVSPHDPNLLFVSCDMNGIYRSEDGGRRWTMLDERMLHGAYSPSSHFVFDPRDHNTIFVYAYAGNGPGALRVSHDRGKTWSVFVSNPPWGNSVVTDLAIDPNVEGRLLVATEDGAYLTQNGKTWTRCAGLGGKIVGVWIDPTSAHAHRRMIAVGEKGVFRSTDDGLTWQESDTGLPWHEIHRFAGGADRNAERTTLYVTIESRAVGGRFEGGVYRSQDGGKTWQSAMGAGINTELGKKDEFGESDIAQYEWLGAAANNPDTVYVTTNGTGYWPPYHFTVYKSTDAGQTWKYVFTGDPRFKGHNLALGWLTWDLGWGYGGPAYGFSVSASNPDIALYTNAGEIYMTTDGGEHWTAPYTRYAPGQEAPGPGQRWESVGLEATTNWHVDFDPRNPQKRYICYTDIGFERSDDGGKSWQFSGKGCPWRNTFYELAVDPDVPGRIWAAASNQHDIPHETQTQGPAKGAGRGGVVLSEDGAQTWRVSSTGLPEAPAVSIVLDPKSLPDRRRLFVSLFGYGVYRSDDGGATWKKKSNGLGYPGNLNSYRLQLQRDGTLYCSITAKRTANYHYEVPSGLWRSRDAGETWECVTDSLKPIWLIDYAVHPTNQKIIYLCTGHTGQGPGGVLKTTDGGKTWRKLSLPVGGANGEDMEAFAPFLHPRDPNIVFVTTTGLGTWLSTDAGATWQEFKAIPFLVTHRITFDPTDPHILYMTTFGGGVWKVTLE